MVQISKEAKKRTNGEQKDGEQLGRPKDGNACFKNRPFRDIAEQGGKKAGSTGNWCRF